MRFDEYGAVDVLYVADVKPPRPGRGQLLVRVRAAGVNPGEAKIRQGAMHERFPATFPSGEGSDLAGVVEEVGEGVTGFAIGDEVLGFTHNRASHAEHVVVEAENVTLRPAGVPWEVAGSLYVVGCTAYAAVRAVSPSASDTVVVAGAAGGVGSLVVQLARRAGAEVVGLASEPHHAWLREHGVIPVTYGEGVAERIRRATTRVDAFIDTVGDGYVELALELGVAPGRIETIIDFAAAQRHGTKMEGSMSASTAAVLAELAQLVERGELEVPIEAVYPLEQVQAAFREVERGHTHGKIVLVP
ncbi:MAG TPA: NADP-dependent oxidoreductase [Solirubrobacteraceae bacterium]|nr:NADP-dependent oxidoreductase [Solirubrobacteraceae bacterium]